VRSAPTITIEASVRNFTLDGLKCAVAEHRIQFGSVSRADRPHRERSRAARFNLQRNDIIVVIVRSPVIIGMNANDPCYAKQFLSITIRKQMVDRIRRHTEEIGDLCNMVYKIRLSGRGQCVDRNSTTEARSPEDSGRERSRINRNRRTVGTGGLDDYDYGNGVG
jgi:hypothetical protein